MSRRNPKRRGETISKLRALYGTGMDTKQWIPGQRIVYTWNAQQRRATIVDGPSGIYLEDDDDPDLTFDIGDPNIHGIRRLDAFEQVASQLHDMVRGEPVKRHIDVSQVPKQAPAVLDTYATPDPNAQIRKTIPIDATEQSPRMDDFIGEM